MRKKRSRIHNLSRNARNIDYNTTVPTLIYWIISRSTARSLHVFIFIFANSISLYFVENIRQLRVINYEIMMTFFSYSSRKASKLYNITILTRNHKYLILYLIYYFLFPEHYAFNKTSKSCVNMYWNINIRLFVLTFDKIIGFTYTLSSHEK